jgi:hypothetical protein
MDCLPSDDLLYVDIDEELIELGTGYREGSICRRIMPITTLAERGGHMRLLRRMAVAAGSIAVIALARGAHFRAVGV